MHMKYYAKEPDPEVKVDIEANRVVNGLAKVK